MKRMMMAAAAVLLSAMSVMAQSESVSVSDFSINAGEQTKVDFNLTNPTNKYCALQFDLFLPTGITIPTSARTGLLLVSLNNDEETGRTVDHTAAVDKAANGSYRFVISSMTNKEFYESAGAIGTITLECDADVAAGTYEGSLENVIVVKADETKVTLDKATFNVTVVNTTGIKGVSMDSPTDVFDVKGNKVKSNATTLNGLQKGVYIVNGQKVVVK